MRVNITARQVTVPDKLKETISKKLTRFDKFFDDAAEASVTLRKRRNREVLELTITNSGTIFRAEEEAESFQTALDSACDTILGQIRKNKTKLQKRLRSGRFDAGIVSEHWDDTDDTDEDKADIRVKEFEIKPMTPEEAILQMDLLRHQFYVFENAESGRTNVVYRRNDGGFGLIIPTK